MLFIALSDRRTTWVDVLITSLARRTTWEDVLLNVGGRPFHHVLISSYDVVGRPNHVLSSSYDVGGSPLERRRTSFSTSPYLVVRRAEDVLFITSLARRTTR